MRIAIPVWQGRVSPVFDVATQMLIVDLDAEGEVDRHCESVAQMDIEQRSAWLAHLGVQQAICCAVSRGLEMLLEARGIRVLSRICGNVDEVLQAYQNGALEGDRFAMPGCCADGQCRRRGMAAGRGRKRSHWRQP